jgi:hypothetical protein
MIKVKHGKLDMSQLAKRVVDLATGTTEETAPAKFEGGGLISDVLAEKAKAKKKSPAKKKSRKQ